MELQPKDALEFGLGGNASRSRETMLKDLLSKIEGTPARVRL